MTKVRDLKEGDLVDMEHLPGIDYHDQLAEFEYGVVDTVEQETPDCFVVHFTNLTSCGFPPDYEVMRGEPCS